MYHTKNTKNGIKSLEYPNLTCIWYEKYQKLHSTTWFLVVYAAFLLHFVNTDVQHTRSFVLFSLPCICCCCCTFAVLHTDVIKVVISRIYRRLVVTKLNFLIAKICAVIFLSFYSYFRINFTQFFTFISCLLLFCLQNFKLTPYKIDFLLFLLYFTRYFPLFTGTWLHFCCFLHHILFYFYLIY